MRTIESLTRSNPSPKAFYGGEFYEFNRHGPEFQAGMGHADHPPARHAHGKARPHDPAGASLPDGVHGDLDVYA